MYLRRWRQVQVREALVVEVGCHRLEHRATNSWEAVSWCGYCSPCLSSCSSAVLLTRRRFAFDAGISQIDIFVNSHYYEDHFGGIDDLVEDFGVRVLESFDRGEKSRCFSAAELSRGRSICDSRPATRQTGRRWSKRRSVRLTPNSHAVGHDDHGHRVVAPGFIFHAVAHLTTPTIQIGRQEISWRILSA